MRSDPQCFDFLVRVEEAFSAIVSISTGCGPMLQIRDGVIYCSN
jgi:hypothetical protein